LCGLRGLTFGPGSIVAPAPAMLRARGRMNARRQSHVLVPRDRCAGARRPSASTRSRC
jgi:hypothetical protein